MCKPRGAITHQHVDCEYNRCRGRDIRAGHVDDCPFQDTDYEAEEDTGDEEDTEDEEEQEVAGTELQLAAEQSMLPS